MFIYKSHLGSYYTDIQMLDYEDLRCEACGDSDTFIGEANTRDDAQYLLYDYEHVLDDDEDIDKALNENGSYDYSRYVNMRKRLNEYLDMWFKTNNNDTEDLL